MGWGVVWEERGFRERVLCQSESAQCISHRFPLSGAGEDQAQSWQRLLGAGINDWGGLSPLTRDFVNPEKPWPHLKGLADATAATGKNLVPR